MLHLKSAVRQDLIVYANALDTMYGYPLAVSATCYSVPFANIAGQADPNDSAAEWAMDISITMHLWDAVDAPMSEWPYPADLNALDPSDAHYVAYPASAVEWQCTYAYDPLYPGWFPQFIGP